MRTYLFQSGTLAVLFCLAATGCTTTPLDLATPAPRSSPGVPAGVLAYSRTLGKARPANLGELASADSPPKKIALIRFQEEPETAPAPSELPKPFTGDSMSPHLAQPGQEINFASALSLASGQNPRVAFAQEQISEAFAALQGANVLWLPTINIGFNYNKHDGRIQDVEGDVIDVARASLATGFGAGAIGAGSPQRHGLYANFRLTDAIFQPRIAGSRAAAQQAAFTATLNDTLLDTALAYLDLLEAYQQEAISRETLAHAQALADLTKQYAETGQGTQADADRALAELTLRQNILVRAGEAIGVASARLMELLNLDPLIPLRPLEPTVVPINLIAPEAPVQELVATGLSNRPELAANRALVSAAIQTLKREKCAPFIPNVQLGASEMWLGGSPSSSIDNFGNRFDFDAILFWEVRNLGCGEAAIRNQLGARVRQAKFREMQVLNRVMREVAEANTQVQARQKQIAVAESGVKAAQASYRLNLERIRGVQGLPLEVLQSIQALDQARREYLRAVTDYNRAQFLLFRAMGWPVNPLLSAEVPPDCLLTPAPVAAPSIKTAPALLP